jgi:hypothetical protein
VCSSDLAGMCAALYLWLANTTASTNWVILAGGVALGGLVYGICLLSIGTREVKIVWGVFRKGNHGS